MTTGVMLLAAGRGARFGSDKRLAALSDGRSMLEHSIANIRQSGLPLLVCLAAEDRGNDAVFELASPCVYCENAAGGMGVTIAEGTSHIDQWDGVLIALADMPLIRPATFAAVAARVEPDNIVTPVYAQRPGHPVGFGQQFFAALRCLQGDRGARELLNRHPAQTITVAVDDPAIHIDIDRPEALAETFRSGAPVGPRSPGD